MPESAELTSLGLQGKRHEDLRVKPLPSLNILDTWTRIHRGACGGPSPLWKWGRAAAMEETTEMDLRLWQLKREQ